MREQVVSHIECRRVSTFAPRDAYIFREDCGWHWLQRLCLSVLRRLGCYDVEETVEIKRHVIDGDKFMERLFKAHQTLVRDFDRRPTKLLIGAEDYAELMRDAPSEMMFDFQSRYHTDRCVMGLIVTVVPWMRGILVMP